MKRKVLVVGLDGLPYTLAKRLCEDKVMPRMAALFRDGSCRAMTSVLPSVSGVAWSAFLTGRNPGQFGVFGFYELDRDLQIHIPDRTWLRVPTFLRELSLSGLQVVSVGIPMTYPPDPVAGTTIGGFLSPSLQEAVHPAALLPVLEAVGYKIDLDVAGAQYDRDRLRAESIESLRAREQALLHLLAQPWDVFVCHVLETDRVHHFFWEEVEGLSTNTTDWIIDFYRAVDHLLGRLVDASGPDTEVMVLSDHGFCRTECEVQLNRWLADEGYLQLAGDPGRFQFQALSPTSRAVALVPGRIHVLTPAFWTNGRVSEDRYAELVEEIGCKLIELQHPVSGRRVCRRVLRRDEVFVGPCTSRAPDLIIEPEDGFDLKASLTATGVFNPVVRTGMHTYGDALVSLRGRELPSGLTSITDCASILGMLEQE